MLNLKKMLFKMLSSFGMFGHELWSGSDWSSGSKTIPYSDKYLAYIIVQSQNPIIAVRNGNTVNGFAITSSATVNTQYIRSFRATVSNSTTWTIEWVNQLNHNANGNHNAGVSQSITKIIGLIPDFVGGVIRSISNASSVTERGWAVC